ncbi:hypothetical protein V5799_010401, partial [Amblyomma americanum]
MPLVSRPVNLYREGRDCYLGEEQQQVRPVTNLEAKMAESSPAHQAICPKSLASCTYSGENLTKEAKW